MESTHQNDVVFTRDSLNKFIKLIKTEGIKNLDYYIMSPSINVKNINGDEFSLGEKTLFSGNIAIVNKSYYTGDPYTKVSLDDNTEEYYKNLKILKYNIKNVFNFPFDDTTDSVSMYSLKSNVNYYLTQEQFNALSTNPKKASDILIHIESPEESNKYIDANVFRQCPTQVDDPNDFYVATVADNDKNGMIFITKQIAADNYNFTFDKNKEASFGYALDSNIVSGANNFMNYLFLEKDENNNYQYYTVDDSNKIDFTKYNQTINAPYEFSIVQDLNDKTQQVVRKFDGQTLFSNTDVAEQAKTIGQNNDLTTSNNLYYQGLKKVKYDKFLDETHPDTGEEDDGTELDNQNVDIFIDRPGTESRLRNYNADLGIYPCFKSNDPLLQAFQKETINNIEEMTYTGTKASNYYQIFWDSTSDHLLHDIKISYGYKENGAVSDSNNVQLMYNYTIPVRSIKIKSWEQLSLNNKTRVFPNIENKNYSAPYNNEKHIIGKWQPNDLVNLFGAYQVLKGREADVGEVEDIRAFTTGNTPSSGTSNAHQIAFTPNNFENAIMNKNVYEHLSSSTAENINYNEFEYIVLDNVPRTYNFNTTITAGELPFGKEIKSDNNEDDTGKKITSATASNGKIYYYNANKGRGSADAAQPAPPKIDTLGTSTYVNHFNSLIESQLGSPYSTISLPTVNTHGDRSYTDKVFGWDMKYVPILSDIHAFILTTTSNNQLDEIKTNISFNFQPFTVTTPTWANMVESSANINITIEYIIKTDKINTQTRIPIYVLPLDSAEFITANSKYSGKILDKNNKYYGLFMTNQTKNEFKTIDGNQYKKYYLIGYLPQTYFWETDLLERSMTSKDNSEECAKSWQILLQDRLNNSINSSLFHDNINTRFIDLHKDLNIFDIVLSSSTKSDGTPIPTSTNGFYEGDLGFYYKEDVNTSREGLYRLQYNPNVIDSETTYYFSNYTNFDVNLINTYPKNIITFQSTTGTNNNIYTAKYTKVDDAASLINTWETDKLYGTISTTAEPKTTSAYSAIKDTDYFLYTRNNNVANDYKEIDRTLKLTLHSFHYDDKESTEVYVSNQYYYEDGDQYKLSITPYPDNNIHYYKVREKALVANSLNTLADEQKLYYKKICGIENSYDIHPSLLTGISSTTDTNDFSLSYYKPISLRPYEANKYQYYAQLLNLNNSDGFAAFLGNVVSANIPVYYRDETYTLVNSSDTYDEEGKFYYQFKGFVQIKDINSDSYNNKKVELHGNIYYLNDDTYIQVRDNDPFVQDRIYYTRDYELLNIVDQEDFNFYTSLLINETSNNLYYKTRKYDLLEIPEKVEDYGKSYKYKYTYYLQQLDNSETFSANRDYYYNDDNDPELELITNFYQPNIYYYYNGVNFILDDNSNMNSNYQYYQLVTLKNLKEQQILNRLNNRFYNNIGYVTTLEYANNTWYYYPKNSTNRLSMINEQGKIFFPENNNQYDQLIYIYNNETSFIYTEDINTIPYDVETGCVKVLILYYTYQPINSNDTSYYIIHTDNSTNTINLLFKYPIFIKQNSDQDELYTKVNPLDKIILDPAAGMEYYIKEYDKDDTATSTIENYTKTDNTIEPIASYDYNNGNLLLMYLNQELGLKKYYNWNYESRRGKECDGTFTVELAKNPYVCASNVGWHWTYGVDEKAEALNNISFSTSTTPTNANNVAKMITPFYDYMSKSESDKIFTADSYSTTNKYEGFTTAVTMQITDKTRTADTISISNQVSSQTISTVNSATNTPSVYMLHKLLNRRNSFNIDYTTNYDYIHGRSNLNSTAGHSDLGAPYQFRTYAQIKNINFFDLENQFQIFNTGASSSTAAASLSTSRASTNASYLHVGTSDNDILDFDQFSVYSTTAYTTTNKNTTILKLVNALNDKSNFFTSHQYREAKIINSNKDVNDYKDFLYYYDTTDNTIKPIESTTYSSTTKYYFKYDDNKPFNAELMLVRYLDNKKEHNSINPSKDSDNNLVHQRDNTNIPCFNKDAWLLLQAQRTSWNETIGDLDYLYLTPEKYYINNQIVYIYFIYQLHYDANAILTKININPNCCIYYRQSGDLTYEYASAIDTTSTLNIKLKQKSKNWSDSFLITTDITKICHLKDPFYELHIGLPKIYQTYFQAIEYWYKNPYPGGAPVFFEDWCKSGKNLKSTRNAKETETRNYYYYGIKLPKDLLIEKSDQYYQYPYSFDIVKNDDDTSLFSNNSSNNHYLVTYRLVEDYLPQISYDDNTEDKGFKDPENNGYTISNFTKALADMLDKEDETKKRYEYYILENTSDSLIVDDHNKIFNDGKAIVLSDIKFKFYTNSNNTFEKSVYIKLSNTKLKDESNITFDSIKGKYYQYNEDNGYSNYELTPSEVKVALNYKVWISDHNPNEDEFARYQLYQYTKNGSIDDILEINTPGLEEYIYSTTSISAAGFVNNKNKDSLINNNGKYKLNISIPFKSTTANTLYLENFENNLGFRHVFLNIPNKKYTNSFTVDNPYPNQAYYLDSDGCLKDSNGNDTSPNGTFSISSGTLNPGVLVQVRGFNNDGEYEGDLNGGTLNNVTFGEGILHVKDTTDAWRKPIIDVINAKLNVKPKNQGGNIYASIVTEGGISAAKKIKGERLYGAIWNDYAEYRQTDAIEPGRCVIETGTGELKISTERLQGGANITSDTFGMGVGETDLAKTPIAVSGRVLAYPYEDRNIFKPGDAVCSGPNGTVSIMNREEIKEWPDRIVGYVSEIPYYETWGTGNVKINGRIWIKIH